MTLTNGVDNNGDNLIGVEGEEYDNNDSDFKK